MRALSRVLLRGLLRLLTLTLPLSVLVSVLNRFGDRSLFWQDSSGPIVGGDPSDTAFLGSPRPGTSVDTLSHLSYAVRHASAGLWLLSLTPGLALAATMSVVALLLLRMMTETYAGRPFGATAGPRLRRIALVIAVAAFVVPVLDGIYGHVLVGHVLPAESDGWLSRWDYANQTVPWLAAPLLLLCVAQAFDHGARLTDDVDGLV